MKLINRLVAVCAVTVMSLSVLAGSATGVYINGDSVGEKTSGVGWRLADGIVQLTDSGRTYTISGTNKTESLGVCVLAKTSTVYAVSLFPDSRKNDPVKQRGAFVLDKNVDVCDFRFAGHCSLQSGDGYAGIEVPSNAKIDIRNSGTGNASLFAGGQGPYWAWVATGAGLSSSRAMTP